MIKRLLIAAMAKLSQVDKLATCVRRRVQAERLDSGTFFMTEAQLAAEYDVSRKVAREAIGRLQALGVLQSRKRKGIVIGRPDLLRLLAESLPSLATSPDDLAEIGRLRYALELGAIELAVRNATDEQIAALGEIEAELERALRSGDEPHRQTELDIRFHTLILEMTGSRMIAGMQRVLEEFFATAPRAEMTAAAAERILWEHRMLYHAIRARDVEAARVMLRAQFHWLTQLHG